MNIYRMKCGCCYGAMDNGMCEGVILIKRGFMAKKEDAVFLQCGVGGDEGHEVDEEISVQEFIGVLGEMISHHEYEQQSKFLDNLQRLFRDAIES